MWIRYMRNLKSKYWQQCKEELHGLKYWRGGQLSTVILFWLEKEMATHTSTLAWRIPGTEEPGGLQSMESQSQTQLSDSHTHTHTHTHTHFSGIPQPGLNVAGNLGITVRRPWETSASSGSRSGKGPHLAQRECGSPPFCSFSLSSFTPVHQQSCGGGSTEDSSCGSIGTHTTLRAGKLSSVPWSCSFKVRAKPFLFFPIFLLLPLGPRCSTIKEVVVVFHLEDWKGEPPRKWDHRQGAVWGSDPIKLLTISWAHPWPTDAWIWP